MDSNSNGNIFLFDVVHVIEISQHECSHLDYCIGVVRMWFGYACRHHVTVTNRLDFFQAQLFREFIEGRENFI